LGIGYVLIWVLPSLVEYNESIGAQGSASGFLTFYFVAAAVVGAFSGLLSGVLVLLFRGLFIRLSGSLAVEVLGVSAGAVVAVCLSYLIYMSVDSRVQPSTYLLLYGTIAVIGLGGFTLMYGKVNRHRAK
jgi:hypothetical protein